MRVFALLIIHVIWLSACSQPNAASRFAVDTATSTVFIPLTDTATATRPPETSQIPVEEPYTAVEEAILILEPGPGSRLLSPVRVSGFADPTFEQHLLIRLVLDDGSQLAAVPTIIQVEAGKRGPFSAEIPFEIQGERQAFVLVSSDSPRDGGITHLASVGVTLASGGAQEVKTREPHSEQIVILQPELGEVVSGGIAHVRGFGLASFEQTLVVEVIDEEGKVVGSQPLIVEAPEWGQPGLFRADVAYTAVTAGAGRIVVRDPSAVFEGDVHVASVEVKLAP